MQNKTIYSFLYKLQSAYKTNQKVFFVTKQKNLYPLLNFLLKKKLILIKSNEKGFLIFSNFKSFSKKINMLILKKKKKEYFSKNNLVGLQKKYINEDLVFWTNEGLYDQKDIEDLLLKGKKLHGILIARFF